MKLSGYLLVALCALSLAAPAQNLETSGGYLYINGDGGLNGYNVGMAGLVNDRVALVFDYDRGWDTSRLGTFALTSVGLIATKARIQDFLAGPRFYFPNKKVSFVGRLTPFVEGEFGETYLRETLNQPSQDLTVFAKDNNFSWMLGGGADYRFSPHFQGRIKMDLLRTHLVDAGQSRFRLALQVVYNLKAVQPK
jgi:hypothetical protein